MTQDFLDDFTDALMREHRGFLILVHHGAARPESGASVCSSVENWPQPAAGSREADMLRAIVAAFAEKDEGPFVVFTEAQRAAVLGALDSLGSALADHEHEWTDGERALFEQATEALGAPTPAAGGEEGAEA